MLSRLSPTQAGVVCLLALMVASWAVGAAMGRSSAGDQIKRCLTQHETAIAAQTYDADLCYR